MYLDATYCLLPAVAPVHGQSAVPALQHTRDQRLVQLSILTQLEHLQRSTEEHAFAAEQSANRVIQCIRQLSVLPQLDHLPCSADSQPVTQSGK